MGGSDSKQENQNKPQEVNVKGSKGSKNKNASKSNSPSNSEQKNKHSKHSSPKNGQEKLNKNEQKYFKSPNNDNKNIQKPNPKQRWNEIGSQDPINQEPISSKQIANIFQQWDQKFHQAGKMSLKIMVITLQPTYQFQKLNRQFSQHFAELSWEYELANINGQNKSVLRFIVNEDGGYYLNFVVDEDGTVHEGDSAIWAILFPMRNDQQVSKVGGYLCERIYQSSQIQNQENTTALDSQIFLKWEQKNINDRVAMRTLLKNRQQKQKLKNDANFEYRQITKYFSVSNEWIFSVLMQQKSNAFKCWMVEKDISSSDKDSQKCKSMSSTLKNDIQNRQKMYIDQMKKKKTLFTNKLPQL